MSVFALEKEFVADVLPGLLMLVLIIELFIEIPFIVTIRGATYFSIVIALCVWVWVRGKDGHVMFWILITAGAIDILLWLTVMLSEAFKKIKRK